MSGLPPGSFVQGGDPPSYTNSTSTDAAPVPPPISTTAPVSAQALSPTPLSPEEAKEVEEELEEAQSLSEAALSIPDSEAADNDAVSLYQPANEAVPGDAGVVASQGVVANNGGASFNWEGVLGHSAQGLGAANAASSAGFSFARTATTFGLQFAKRLTQGLVAVPALLADGALTGSAPGDTSGNPSIAKAAHAGIATFFDAISLVAVGGIDLTSAVTSASLGAAGSGVEGVRRALGSEVLRSLAEFSKLVKREWNADDDSLPPGGIPAYSIITLTKALTTWVNIQIITRSYYEQRMLKGLREINTDKLKAEVEGLRQTHHVDTTSAPLRPITAGSQGQSSAGQSQSDVRITSNQTFTGELSGNVIGAEIGHKDGSSSRLPGSDEPARALTDAEAVHNLQRYSKLVLGVYGGIALYWLNSMPPGDHSLFGETTFDTAKSSQTAPAPGSTIFSAEEEFIRRDQAEFLEAASQMELEDEDEDLITATETARANANKQVIAVNGDGKGHATSYNLWDVISGTHDEDLFHHTAGLERGAAAEGSYANDRRTVSNGTPSKDKARPSKPRFYVVTDHPRKTIILVLRGTLCVGDVAADLTCESVPFIFDPEVKANLDAKYPTPTAADGKTSFVGEEAHGDLCHEGMYITAHEIGAPGRSVHRAVSSALAANPGYSIDVTGHSLGAGVASVLAMMWADPTTGLTTPSSGLPSGRRLHAYCFAVPCVTSSPLGRKVGSIITSYTYSFDLVCRLSLGSIQDIRNCSAWLCYEDKQAAHGDRTMNALMKRAFEYQSGRLEQSKRAEVEHEMLVLRKTLEANMHNTHLFPPGKVLYALKEGDDIVEKSEETEADIGRGISTNKRQRLFTVNNDDESALRNVFGQMIFSRTMLSAHMPNMYDASLHDLTR
ncbi:Lipase, class 3 [Kalmanozyma brasiliensis GHG001]|uniref:sn-1-specific diacylglycerol lipase n=1 Tax=Kalmanozyma brasiliensis (strain GHG001) TaxID=1365824 RepID=V5GNZ7_KALBG|nr:Lipase, class 3 [Kalmanozyma brasiliensis GHG001]EST07682.1 Lipase, class 3 [Kalmanozyma brasiliensis GHG001]